MIKISMLVGMMIGALLSSSMTYGRVERVDYTCDNRGKCVGTYDVYVGDMAVSALGLYGKWYSWWNGLPYDSEDWSAGIGIRVLVSDSNGGTSFHVPYRIEPSGPFAEAFTVHNLLYNSNGTLKGDIITLNPKRVRIDNIPMRDPGCRAVFQLWAYHQSMLRHNYTTTNVDCHVPEPVSCHIGTGGQPLVLDHGAVAVGPGVRPRPVSADAFVTCNRGTNVRVRVVSSVGGRIPTSMPGVSSVITIGGNPGQGDFYNVGGGNATTIPIASTLTVDNPNPTSGPFTGSGVIQVDIL